MKRVVSNLLAAETQSLLNGSGHAEWIAAHLAEMSCSSFAVEQRSKALALHQVALCGRQITL